MKLVAFLILTLAASGCTSTHSIYRSEPGEIELLNERMQGHHATVELADGTRDVGTVLFVRTDSTAWHNTAARRSVLTEEVARMTRHWQGNQFRNGVLIGGGIGVAFAVPTLIQGDSFLFDAETAAAAYLGSLLGLGVIYGAVAARRRAYVLRP